jgi:hypothetical protein
LLRRTGTGRGHFEGSSWLITPRRDLNAASEFELIAAGLSLVFFRSEIPSTKD